ncbi:MAG TPA: amidohydrolase family protein [Acidimicrobiales bacterium]|nr:amidohydrolase family protein [Acidimicrobiales bacterium]
MATYDLVIRNGVVVDGTGLPRRRADVAITGGRVAEIGFVDGRGTRELEADGRVVAPGIVDPHTHYDPQLTFEPYATSSCFHGVTTVVAGNCGFSVAPLRPGDADWLIQLFARVEGMDASALKGIPFDGFETFPEYLDSVDGKLGVNAAFYVGHCAVRRYVMGDACQEREATDAEIDDMATVVANAMRAGAAGFSSSHSPTHFDSADRPIPSRLASFGELERLVEAAGQSARGGSIAYLPLSAVGGITADDEALLVRMSLSSRLPVVIQGLGARSKIDAPTAGWDNAKRFVDEATAQGAAVYSMAMSKPFNRTFDLATGTKMYEGALEFHRMFTEAPTVEVRIALLDDPSFRDSIRDSVEHPNRDAAKGPTLPPPHWSVLHVNKVSRAENEKYVGRSLVDIAAELGVHPTDAMLDIALSEDLHTEFLWKTETPEWIDGTREAQADPHMLVGTSDGGAHLDRDDGAEAHSYFLQHWVREWKGFTLEEGVRQITAIPAALLGIIDRGLLLPGYAADVYVFDPDTIAPAQKEFVHDFPNGAGRWTSKPQGAVATIVNGVPIVLDGELQPDAGLPGAVIRPNMPSRAR